MFVGLIVERRGDGFIIYCNSQSFELPVSIAREDYEVGCWIGLQRRNGDVEDLGIIELEGLPSVRVVSGKVEVLTSGRLARPFCITKEFGPAPILCSLPIRFSPTQYQTSDVTVDVWAVWLDRKEREDHHGLLWGVKEIIGVVDSQSDLYSEGPSKNCCGGDEVSPPIRDMRLLAHYEFTLGRSEAETVKNIEAALGKVSALKDMVYKWFEDFRNGDGRLSENLESVKRAEYTGGSGTKQGRIEELLVPDQALSGSTGGQMIQIPNEDEVVLLDGVIIRVARSASGSGFVGFVWTRHCVDGRLGILDLGTGAYERSIFKPGTWIQFHLPANYAAENLGSTRNNWANWQLSMADCEVMDSPFSTYALQRSIEMDVSIAVSVSHRTGDDFLHETLGPIWDPRRLLEGGREYTVRVVHSQPRRENGARRAASWKVLGVTPIGESWAPRHSRKEKPKRVLPNNVRAPPELRKSDSRAPEPSSPSSSPSPSEKDSKPPQSSRPRLVSSESRELPPVVAKPLDAEQSKIRRSVTGVAMVEACLQEKYGHWIYRVWLLEYHIDAEYSANRQLNIGHIFQGRFRIGGNHKNRCSDYIQPWDGIMKGYFDTEANEVEVDVEGRHTNRKNGACYEVYHEWLGFVRDTQNLLKPVNEPTLVPITARRRPFAAEGGRLVWQIVEVRTE